MPSKLRESFSLKKYSSGYWKEVTGIIAQHVKGGWPSVSEISRESADPFKVLISTIISLRTKDKVTFESSARLFAIADTPEKTVALESEEISRLIYPAGFFRKKGENIREISRIILEQHNGCVPKERDALLALPGVGLKTANLVLSLGWGIPAICVDIHVHRISNRMGWVTTKTPDDTEKALSRILPVDYWISINELLVLYGQQVCTPLSPRCSLCPLNSFCKRIGVDKHR